MSTILDALKKVEGQGGKATRPTSESTELDRQIVHGGSSSIATPARRSAAVLLAIAFAVLAGAGVAWFGIVWMQQEATPAVASAGPDADALDAGLVGVEVAGNVREVVNGASVETPPANDDEELDAEPATALMARPSAPEAFRTAVVSATPPEERETVVIPPPAGARNQLDPVKKLAARRKARVSGLPREGREKQIVAAAAAEKTVKAERKSSAPAADPPPAPEPRAQKPAPEPVAVARVSDPKPEPKPETKPEPRAASPKPSVQRRAPAPEVIAAAIERPPVEIVDIARAKPTPPPEPASAPERIAKIDRSATLKVGVTSTTWHPYKSRRSAEITILEPGGAKLLTVREGQDAGPYKVAEISPSGVTFVHEGVELQRRVGAEAR